MTDIVDIPVSPPVELVRRYGGPVSHAALDPSHSVFRAPGIDGLIGYMLVGRCAVAMGDPVCAPEQQALMADAFAAYCAGNDWSILYSAATAPMQSYAHERGYATMEFASLLIADPQHDPEAGHQGRRLRQHLNRTRRTGVTVREYLGEAAPDARLEAQVEAACEQWRAARHGLQLYLGRPRLFDDKPGRRWFIAEQAGNVVGMLSMLRISSFECHSLINLVFSSPDAPLHCNELMVATALQALREEGARSVCFGVAPLETLGRIDGCSAITESSSRCLYWLTAKVMNLHGCRAFWGKYQVTRREPLYLLFQSPRIGFHELSPLFRTFNFSVT